jgi:hypothetical protein
MSGEVQAVTFSSHAVAIVSETWIQMLSQFGYLSFSAIASDGLSGYALYDSRDSALAAAEALHESKYPPDTDNEISFQLCDLEELELRVQLGNPGLQSVRISAPETGASLFRVTSTQPPIVWRPRIPE